MLILHLRKREQIEITTPSGKVSLFLFGDGSVGIDAPKTWEVRRLELPNPMTITRRDAAVATVRGGPAEPESHRSGC